MPTQQALLCRKLPQSVDEFTRIEGWGWGSLCAREMRIAFDLDGTLADMHAALKMVEARLFEAEAGEPPATEAGEEGSDAKQGGGGNRPASDNAAPGDGKRSGLSRGQQRRLWRAAAEIENFWETLEEIEPGSVRAIAEHTLRRGWEVIFLTQRPRTSGRTSQMQSQRWLRAHGFSLPSVFVVSDSRGKIADALRLDAVVDDLPENCVDVVSDSRAAAVLVRRRESARINVNAKRLGITVVPSVAEALSVLVDLERRHRRPMTARLKEAIGLQ